MRKMDMLEQPFLKIAEDYIASIDVPIIKLSPKIILCPVGFVGAGKTTVVKALSKKLSLVRISGDEIRKRLKEAGFGYEATKEISDFVAENFLKQGYNIALDANCANPKTQKNIELVVEKYNLTDIWIHINPPEEFIINKLKNHPQPTWLFSSAERAIENYFQSKKDYQDLIEKLLPRFIYTFDTSKNNLEHQINEAVELIKNKLNTEIYSR